MDSVCVNLGLYINMMQNQMYISTVKKNMWEVLPMIELSVQFSK